MTLPPARFIRVVDEWEPINETCINIDGQIYDRNLYDVFIQQFNEIYATPILSWNDDGVWWFNNTVEGIDFSDTGVRGGGTAPVSPLVGKPHIDEQNPRRLYMASFAINEINEIPEMVSRRQIGHFGRQEVAMSTLETDIADITTFTSSAIAFKERGGSNTTTITTATPHGYVVGSVVFVSVNDAVGEPFPMSGLRTVLANPVPTATKFSYANPGPIVTVVAATGTVSHGTIHLRLPEGKVQGVWGQSWIGQDSAPLINTRKGLIQQSSKQAFWTYQTFDFNTRKLLGVVYTPGSAVGSPAYTNVTAEPVTAINRVSEMGSNALTIFAQCWQGKGGFQSRLASIGMEAAEDQVPDGHGGMFGGGRINFMTTSRGPKSQRVTKASIEPNGTIFNIGSWAEDINLAQSGARLVASMHQTMVDHTGEISTIPGTAATVDFWVQIEDGEGLNPLGGVVTVVSNLGDINISYTGYGVGDGVTSAINGVVSDLGRHYMKGCRTSGANVGRTIAHGQKLKHAKTAAGLGARVVGSFLGGLAVWDFRNGALFDDNRIYLGYVNPDTTMTGFSGLMIGEPTAGAVGFFRRSSNILQLLHNNKIRASGSNPVFESFINLADPFPTMQIGGSGAIEYGPGTTAPDVRIKRMNTGLVGIRNGSDTADAELQTGVLRMIEIADPGVAPANGARLYTKDNGAGKTQLVIIFNTGSPIVLATQV